MHNNNVHKVFYLNYEVRGPSVNLPYREIVLNLRKSFSVPAYVLEKN